MISAIADAVRWTWSGGYNIVSGPLADITLLGLFGIAYRRLNCHVTGCRHIGLHHVAGTGYVTCRRHHPTISAGPVTVDQVHHAHRKANEPTSLHFDARPLLHTTRVHGPRTTRPGAPQ